MSSEDNDKTTEQVLEYYKKYSQNRNLSKYFSGTSVSYLPPIITENEDERAMKSAEHKNYQNESLKVVEPKIVVLNTSATDSSSESQSEHKKLEWDNGADIGYNSARKQSKKKLQKSLSLPILDDLKDLNVPTIVPSTIITHSSSSENLGILVFSSTTISNQTSSKNSPKHCPMSSSSAADSSKEQHPSTNSSSPLATTSKHKVSTSDTDETKFENFQKNIDYLKSKIGLPGAQSTPNPLDSHMDKVRSMEDMKNLKPTLSEYNKSSTIIDSGSSTENKSVLTEVNKMTQQAKKSQTMRKVETKIIELSISTPINVNCKGLGRVDKALHAHNEVFPKAVQTDIIQQRHIETQIEFNEKVGQRTASVSEGTADLASSFEYISAAKDNEQGRSKIKGISGVLKEISLKKNSTESSARSCQEEDIDKHLNLLQKLLKTKKINSSSKRKYIKKLLKQLSELETSNDTSTSSDLFIPKRESKTKPKVVFKNVKDSILSSEGPNLDIEGDKRGATSKSSSESECQRCITDLAAISTKPCKKLERKEAVEQEISTSDSSKLLTASANVRSLSTSTGSLNVCSNDNKISSLVIKSSKISSQGDKDLRKNSQRISEHQSVPYKSLNSAGTVDTIRCSTTTDLKRKYSDDYLLKFAENERSYQLNWINNEISHLSKLKNILELKSSKVSRPQTSTYSVTQKDNSDKKSERNYIIKTDLNIQPNQLVNYVLDGKEYNIKSDSQKSSSDSDKAIIADIEIRSSENQTSIKLSTLCASCKQIQCICSAGNTLQSKIPSLQSEVKSPCSSCQKIVCECKVRQKEDSAAGNSGEAINKEPSQARVLEKLLNELSTDIEDHDSLQRVFKKCCCTVENTNCSCDFVKKLLAKFQIDRARISSSNEAVQTDNDLLRGAAASPVLELIENTKVCSENHIGLQALKEVFCKSTQTQHSGVNESTQVSRKSSLKGTSRSSNSLSHASDDAKADIQGEKIKTSTETSKNVGVQVFPNFYNNDVKLLAKKLQLQSTDDVQTEINNVLEKDINTDVPDEKESKQTFVDEGTQYSRSSDIQLTSGTTSKTSMSSSSRITCCYCKQKAFLAEVSYLQEGNDSLAVCSRCYYNHRPRYCSHNQKYTYCPCRTRYHSKSSGDSRCKCCRLDKSKCLRRPHWLAYTVTLKDDEKRMGGSSLDGIKVQKGWSWKSLKNKENYYKKDDYNKSKVVKKSRKKKAIVEDKDEMEKDKLKKNEVADKNKNEEKEEKNIHYTLMEYLIKNRPEFISSAEYRRQMLLNSRILREQQKEALKLNFLENNLRNPVEATYKLFSESEMRDINKRHYKKLPEIQDKLITQRENRLRHADRLISNMFAKKIQKSVLQGRDNFPIDKPLTSL